MLYTDRVSIIAVGVGNYRYMSTLLGPPKDVEKIKKLLCDDNETALYPKGRFDPLINPESEQLRKKLVEYAKERSAPNDILIFYFSGHGVIIGNEDLGLCTVDTDIHPQFSIPIPFNLIRFSDIIETLSAVKVYPVIIIDACFSGQAGKKIILLDNLLKRKIQAETGSAYALLCSSKRIEPSIDNKEGGLFSKILVDIANIGNSDKNYRSKRELSLKDLFPYIRERIEKDNMEIVPQLFLGDTLLDFGFVRNKGYKPMVINIVRGQVAVLKELWDNGKPRILSVDHFQKIGSTAHTTYLKLSYKPAWGLIEKVDNKRRKLSDRGIQFMEGKLKIPKSIIKQDNGEWVADINTQLIGIESYNTI